MIEWKQSMSVGNEKLDSEHKELVSKINDLMNAAKEGRGKALVLRTVSFLGDYAQTHFADEEKYMLEHMYPALSEHKKIHIDFIKKFLEFKKKIEGGEITSSLTIDVQNFLGNWLINHIMKEDKKYADFIAKGAN